MLQLHGKLPQWKKTWKTPDYHMEKDSHNKPSDILRLLFPLVTHLNPQRELFMYHINSMWISAMHVDLSLETIGILTKKLIKTILK